MKLLSVAVPCYNSESYMNKCIDSLLKGGEKVEIIIVNDGSSDGTAAIADDYAARYPDIIRVIHKENGGHGSGVNAGIRNATGVFFKVVDSDDWVDEESYLRILSFLNRIVTEDLELDLLLSNYVYEKVGARHKKVMKPVGFPRDRFFGWEDVGHLRRGHYILMHSAIYRTQVLRDSGMVLPEHTFYVDNIYVFQPMPYVKTMYYLDVNFYRYFIGRSDQSVNEQVMVKRQDQQLKVNRLMVDVFAKENVQQPQCYKYMRSYLEMITTISSVILLLDGSDEAKEKTKGLWSYIKEHDPRLYKFFRRSPLLNAVRLPGRGGRQISLLGYHIAQKIFGFN